MYFGPCKPLMLLARLPPTEQCVHGACTGLQWPKHSFKHVFISKIFGFPVICPPRL